MNITLPVSVGEALDKLSILLIKSQKITDPTRLNYVNEEIQVVSSGLSCLGDYSEFLSQLVHVNEIMWDCNEKRKQKINDGVFDQEYIDLTIQESTVNDERFVLKNRINQHFGSVLREQKSYSWVT